MNDDERRKIRRQIARLQTKLKTQAPKQRGPKPKRREAMLVDMVYVWASEDWATRGKSRRAAIIQFRRRWPYRKHWIVTNSLGRLQTMFLEGERTLRLRPRPDDWQPPVDK